MPDALILYSSKVNERQLELRKRLWPDLSNDDLWLRKRSKGFTTIPRTMPLILTIMDALSPGKPLSSVYLDIWCRAFDECLVVLNKRSEMAFSAGFFGQRAEQTWAGRVKLLADFGFIRIQSGPSGPLSYAVIIDPYKTISRHRIARTEGLTDALHNALCERAAEIGALDLNQQTTAMEGALSGDESLGKGRDKVDAA